MRKCERCESARRWPECATTKEQASKKGRGRTCKSARVRETRVEVGGRARQGGEGRERDRAARGGVKRRESDSKTLEEKEASVAKAQGKEKHKKRRVALKKEKPQRARDQEKNGERQRNVETCDIER
eukprot:3928746-Pleurochrysis_carterae.AAC.1